LIHLFCGIIIGIVMGLTGAGGALIAIPLFMQFLGMGLKEASVYSLVAVVVASLLNYVPQRKSTQYFTAILIVTSSSVGSYLTTPLKEKLPTFLISITLALVSLYALYGVWSPVETSSENEISPGGNTTLSLAAGLMLGVLTTFTGLGGGVLMLPLFLTLLKYSYPQAISTSLLAVGLSSLASLVIQVMNGAHFDVNVDLIYLLIGVLASVFILQLFVKRLPLPIVKLIRQVVFTLVVVLALLKIF
jgi:uncharacterized membrane protein YfcA